MMTTLPVFTLSSDGNDVALVNIMPPGPPVEAIPAKGARIDRTLTDLFPLAMALDPALQLVTCRIIGLPDTHPGHEKQLLVKGGVLVQTYGRTI